MGNLIKDSFSSNLHGDHDYLRLYLIVFWKFLKYVFMVIIVYHQVDYKHKVLHSWCHSLDGPHAKWIFNWNTTNIWPSGCLSDGFRHEWCGPHLPFFCAYNYMMFFLPLYPFCCLLFLSFAIIRMNCISLLPLQADVLIYSFLFAVTCSYHLLLHSRNGLLALISRSLRYYYALATKWIFFQVIQLTLNTDDACWNLENLVMILILSSRNMEYQKVKEVVCWETKSHHRRLRGLVRSGALNTILNTLKHVHQMLNLTNVRAYYLLFQDMFVNFFTNHFY